MVEFGIPCVFTAVQVVMDTPTRGRAGIPSTMQALEDSVPSTNGGSRRQGNVWSTEARLDMYNRRLAGEEWETICPVNIPEFPLASLCLWIFLSYSFSLAFSSQEHTT